jgi:hypothetical protein
MISSIDEKVFETPEGVIRIQDVVNGNVEHLDQLLDLYSELFPQYISALPRVREKALLPANIDPRFIRHQWIVLWNDVPAGLVSFKFAVRQRLGLCLSIGVLPAFRSIGWGDYRRVSDFLIQQMIRQIELDAAGLDAPPPIGLVVEVEMAEGTTDPALKTSLNHLLERYQKYGFVKLPIRYNEPASVRGIDSEQEDAHPMHLCLLPLFEKDEINPPTREILGSVISALLMDHYGLSEDHWIVKQAQDSI